jgi:cytochrome b subunit of formate dehydrogenase
MSTPHADAYAPQPTYRRFSKSDRVQHLVMLVSFLVLTVTGLPQKFIWANNRYLDDLIDLMGGIEAVRVIHRVAAIALMLVTAFHMLAIFHRLWVRRVSLSMLPRYQDAVDALQAVRYNLGLAKQRPRMDRYTWEEKVEYWSLIWGTIVMIATGFMLWNPVATARFLPGQWIPAAQVIHGGEALLAILAVLVWHFYSVHLRHFNRSMFTGEMSEHEMAEEHPLELDRIKAGAEKPADAAAVAARHRIFVPIACVTTAIVLAGLYWFVTFEQTAITTLPGR